jgi:hypothetical protein
MEHLFFSLISKISLDINDVAVILVVLVLVVFLPAVRTAWNGGK